MEVTYQITSRDLKQALRCVALPKRLVWQYGWILQLLLCTVPGALALALVGEILVPLVMWSVLVLLIAIRWLAARTHRPDDTLLAPAMTLRMTPDFLESSSSLRCGRRHWSQVIDVVEKPDFLALVLPRRRMLPIPGRAFASSEEMRRFANEARRHMQRARQQSLAGPLEVPRCDPPQTQHQRIRVRYQNAAAQVVRFRLHGLGKSANPLLGGLTAIVLTLAMTASLSTSQATARFDRLIPAALFMFLSSFTTLWIWTLLRPTFDRLRIERELLEPLTLAFDDQGVTLQSPTVSSWEGWSAFRQLQQNEELLALVRPAGQDALLIPKAAFQDPADLEQVLKLARAGLARAQEQPPDESSAGASVGTTPTIETGNPYQPPTI
jgi:hypothetical protein